jgi:hypothetical protein
MKHRTLTLILEEGYREAGNVRLVECKLPLLQDLQNTTELFTVALARMNEQLDCPSDKHAPLPLP